MQPGEQLAGGRFTLEQQITRSGMAEVWLARQTVGGGMSKSVVIKMIHPDLNAQQEARQRFFDEARFMSKIHHANVVQFYDFGEDSDDLLFQVMEYIDGYALEQVVARCRDIGRSIPISLICRLVSDACKGLGYIHELKDERGESMEMVHRDISPQNLLIAQSGTIKIIDFGIVKAKEKSSRTKTGVIVGKLQYMSPEQLSSEDLDRRSDIYSMGLVFYELLTLQQRFRGGNLLEVFYEALNEPPPAVVDLRPDCPPEVVACLHNALAMEKESRYASAYHMQEALVSFLHRQGHHVSERQIASFMQEIFLGDEDAMTEHTTQIHAASLLGANFMDDIGEETVAALATDILHGGLLDDEGTVQAGPGFADMVESAGLQAMMQSDYNTSPGHIPPSHTGPPSHTLSSSNQTGANSGFSGQLGDHTLASGMVSDMEPHYETFDSLHQTGRRGIDHDNAEPTRINAAMPELAHLTNDFNDSGIPPIPEPPGPATITDSPQSVMVSPALMAEAGSDIEVYGAGKAPVSRSSKQAKPMASKAKPAPAANSGPLSLSWQNWLIIGLGAVVFGVFTALFVILLSR